MNFEYTSSVAGYENYLTSRVCENFCKHVCRPYSLKAQRVVSISNSLGYTQVFWGYGEGYYSDIEKNRIIQISRIQRFIYDSNVRSIRVVIDKDGDMWFDNLHSTLAHVLCRGGIDNADKIKTYDLPVYIVDMRNNIPKIVDMYRLVEFDREKISGMISVSEKRCGRVSAELKQVGYTIGEFITENGISWNSLTLDKEVYTKKFIEESDKIFGHSY